MPDSNVMESAVPVPQRLQPLLAELVEACVDQGRVLAAWLGGSLAKGVADDWSDIDLHLVFDNEGESFDVVGWFTAVTPVVLADSIPGLSGAFIFVTPDWVQVDVVLHSSDELQSGDGAQPGLAPRLVLVDKGVAPHDTPAREVVAGAPYLPTDQVRLFLYFMGKVVTMLRRGELVALSGSTAAMRDLLVQLMLAENGIRKEDGPRRLNRYLDDEQLECLRGLPPVGMRGSELREAQQRIAVAYLSRGRALASACGGEWPAALERATKDFWRRELGISI